MDMHDPWMHACVLECVLVCMHARTHERSHPRACTCPCTHAIMQAEATLAQAPRCSNTPPG
eukprot:2639797-Alexandrium_andersonii.AAC.1